MLLGRNQQQLAELKQQLAADDRVITHSGDLSTPEGGQHAVSVAADTFKEIHGLVHLVGLFIPGPVSSTPLPLYQRLFQANVLTAISITQPLLAYLAEGANLIYASSFLAHDPVQGLSGYAASKAALVAWCKALARELRPRVSVNVVSTTTLASPEARARFQGKAAARLLEPESVAQVIASLTTPEMRAIHGAVVPVYGNFALEDPAFL